MFGPPPPAEQLAREMSKDMPSPYCPGRSISSCPSGMARKLEEDILAAANEGQTRDQIEETLIARFGREKMGYEQSTAVFVFTTLAALLAIVGFVLMARRMAKARARATAPPTGKGGSAARAASGDSNSPSQAELDDLEEALDGIEGL